MDEVRKELRRRLARRQQQKAEMERQLHAVQQRYREEVGPLKEKVLRLRMERLQRQAQRHMRSARHRNAYHDAQREYETFLEERDRATPSAEDVKRRYREASKRCHPDVVPEAYRESAAATFQVLESAYEAGQVRTVRAIADALARWGFPHGSSGSSEEGVGRSPHDLRRAVSNLESAIEAIRDEEAYRAVVEAGDVDSALRAQQEALLKRLHAMKRRSV